MRGDLKSRMAAVALITPLVTGGASVSGGRERHGPAEREGQAIDRAVEDLTK